MNDTEHMTVDNTEPQEQEIDLLELGIKLWNSRKYLLKWIIGGIIFGLIIAFSIPREYTSTVVLAPEVKDAKSSAGGLGSLAALAGISLGSSSADAVNPVVYPDIVSSVPFNAGLFGVMVETNDPEDPKIVSVREYLEEETRTTWWGWVFSLPFKALKGIKSLITGEEDDEAKEVDPYELTKDEEQLIKEMNERIAADVDNKTAIITVSVTMQDPRVAAMLADTVVEKLQKHVTDYRTNKARKDLEYAQLLYDEARDEYMQAQKAYANYADRNQMITLQSGRIEMERLQQEANLKYSVFNTTAQQLQVAKAKVQEMAPVYTVIKPARIVMKPSKPSKPMILIVYTFLAFVIGSAWVLFGHDFMQNLRQKQQESKLAEAVETEAATKEE